MRPEIGRHTLKHQPFCSTKFTGFLCGKLVAREEAKPCGKCSKEHSTEEEEASHLSARE